MYWKNVKNDEDISGYIQTASKKSRKNVDFGCRYMSIVGLLRKTDILSTLNRGSGAG